MSQFFKYPPTSITATNPSVGLNNTPAPTSSTEIGGVNAGNLIPVSVDASGNLNVNVVSPAAITNYALETGGHLASLDTKTPSLGQALMAASRPVVIASNQSAIPVSGTVAVSSLPSIPAGANAIGSVSVSNFPGTQPISGTVTANQGTGGASAWKVDGSAVTQPVSAASLPLPANAAIETGGNLASINTKLPSNLTVTSTRLLVDGSGVTQPVSGSVSTVSPANGTPGSAAPASATQVGGSDGANLRALSVSSTGVLNVASAGIPAALGQTTMSASQPVVIASDQSNVNIFRPDITASGTITTQNLNPSTGTATANSTVQIALNGYSTVGVQITGTYTGTLTPQMSVDGTNWITGTSMLARGTDGTIVATVVSGLQSTYYLYAPGMTFVRLSANAAVTGTATITMRASTASVGIQTIGSVTLGAGPANATVGNVNTNLLSTNADIASAAATTTTTSGTVTVAFGAAVSFNIAITVVSGTNPTYDFSVQESGDGTNWTTIYQAPRQTATGFYITPEIQLNGNRYRTVETIGGTTPSFTRAVTSSRSARGLYNRNLIDRTIAPTTTNSVTQSLFCEGANNYTIIINQGSGGSAVTFALDGSDDNSNWVQNVTTAAGVVGGATPIVMAFSGMSFRYIRVRVVLGVASTTISYISLIANQIASPRRVTIGGKPIGNAPVRNDYTSVNVTNSAYTQLVAATTGNVSELEIFDSSGSAIYLATGAAGSEVNQIIIVPGGNGRIPLGIATGSRISVMSVATATINTGELDINFYN